MISKFQGWVPSATPGERDIRLIVDENPDVVMGFIDQWRAERRDAGLPEEGWYVIHEQWTRSLTVWMASP